MCAVRIAIVGGGIAGLSAAYELEQARASGSQVAYTLFEASGRLGGLLSSQVVDGALLEHGPDSFLTEKRAASDLCRELGLGSELIPSNDAGRKTWIVVRNRLVPLPEGLMFLVPTRLVPTALSPLFSWSTKFRMALELLHPPRPTANRDESVASLVERHYGRQAVERLADPLLRGIYGGDATQLSARTVLPRMVEMEREFGSLTRAMLTVRSRMRKKAEKPSRSPVGEAVFTTLEGGLQQLVGAITARLDPASISLRTPVSAIQKSSDGWTLGTQGQTHAFDAIIMASPAWAAAAMLSPVDQTLAAELAAIPYSSSVTINLIYDESKLGRLPDGFGFLVPAVEGRSILACTFVHRKFLGRTPPGKAVLRAFLGGVNSGALLAQSDSTLVATVRHELSEIISVKTIGASAEPEHAQVSRWPRAMPQYAVGHKERMDRITAHIAALPGLRLAGNAYDGIGIPDAIRLGRYAAKDLLANR